MQLVAQANKGKLANFRTRPVVNPRFLIGAAATCDLRLGGDDMPALHSIITVSEREIALEAIAAEPAMIVNGRRVEQVCVHDGDLIAIGEVELLARFEAGQPPAQTETASVTTGSSVERPVSELSAIELVDRIEHEERQIEEFEQRQNVGAQALTEALMGRVRRAANRPADARVRAPIPAPHFLSKRPQILAAQTRQTELNSERDPEFQKEIEELGRQLSSLSHDMKGSTLRAVERESTYAEAADTLLDTQEKLVSQLEVLLDQVQTLKENDAPVQKPRAIA